MFMPRKSALLLTTAFMFGAQPLFAEEICGGLGEGTIWLGGGASSSDLSSSSSYLEQMALVLGSTQYNGAFSISEVTDIRVEAAGRGNGDPVIDLFDASGQLIATDDDSGGGADARIETQLEAGTYCVALRSFEDAPMTAFVRAGRQDQEALTDGYYGGDSAGGDYPYDEACAAGAAGIETELRLGETVSNTVSDVSAYRFTLTEPLALSITADNETADPLITLYSSDGTYIEENDDFDGLNPRLSMVEPLAAGDYCLSVRALSDEFVPVDVLVTEYDPAAAALAAIKKGEMTPPLDGSYPINDLGLVKTRQITDLSLGADVGWIKFDIAQPGLVVLEAIGMGSEADPELALFDDLGRELSRNDDYGTTLDSFIAYRVNSGSYLAAVGNVSEAPDARVRVLIENFVPAQ